MPSGRQCDLLTFILSHFVKQDFKCYFLYIGYDTISDKHQLIEGCSDTPSEVETSSAYSPGNRKHQQYRKFVQTNKDAPWAKELLQSVACVNRARNQYKVFLPMLLERNMGALFRVCNDIVTSSTPPHKEVQYMERCFITGVWQEKNIDLSKGGRGSGESSPSDRPGTPVGGASPSLSSSIHASGSAGMVYISPR